MPPGQGYLGTDLTPEEYYRVHSEEYLNPHEDAIQALLGEFLPYIHPRVLDLGCGPGLATRTLGGFGVSDILGVDQSAEMVARYTRETGRAGLVGAFWGELPAARTAVFTHSLHLCLESRLHEVVYQLRVAGVERAVVISPLKRAALDLPTLCASRAPSGPCQTTIWGWVFSVSE